jgi:hypothetical protein
MKDSDPSYRDGSHEWRTAIHHIEMDRIKTIVWMIQHAKLDRDDSPKIELIIEHKPASVDYELVVLREYEKSLLSVPVSLSASASGLR